MALDKLKHLFSEETVEITPDDMPQIEKENDLEDDTFKIETPKTSQAISGRNIVRMYTPLTKSIVPSIIDAIKREELVLVNLSRLPEDEGKFIFQTLSGTLYALDGELKVISEGVMLCAPQRFIVEEDDAE